MEALMKGGTLNITKTYSTLNGLDITFSWN